MNRVHVTLQSKGGVGKSLVASFVAQHQLAKARHVFCIDANPVCPTLSQYDGLHAVILPPIEDGAIELDHDDKLMGPLLAHDGEVVLDSGPCTFFQLSKYLLTEGGIARIAEAGREVWMHAVVTGGPEHESTMKTLADLAESLPEATRLFVWRNAFFGEVEANGVPFESLPGYRDHASRVHGIVALEKPDPDMVQPLMSQMLSAAMTFDEAIVSESFRLMEKQRLKMAKDRIFDQLDAVIG